MQRDEQLGQLADHPTTRYNASQKSLLPAIREKQVMQAILDIPTTTTPTVSQTDAQRTADAYLTTTLGSESRAVSGTCEQDGWSFLIRCHRAATHQPCIVGRLSVNVQTPFGHTRVIPLTSDHLREVRECADWGVARTRGELARDVDGYVSRHQARQLARRWLDQHLAMKYAAKGGIFIPLATQSGKFRSLSA